MKAEKKETALERLLATVGCRTQNELADLLGITQSSVASAKKRNVIPAEWLVKLLHLKGLNPEWVLTGEGQKYLAIARDKTPTDVIYVTEIRPPKECSSQELINELVCRAMSSVDNK